VPGSLPSSAHLDLLNAYVIGDPYYGLNNFNLRWVAFNNWTYSAPVSGLDTKASLTWLVFNGLDTFTTIEMCGQQVATTNNQFRQWVFDISSVLASCSDKSPELSINFGSAPQITAEIAAEPGMSVGAEQV
jgi:beta-mannosidase